MHQDSCASHLRSVSHSPSALKVGDPSALRDRSQSRDEEVDSDDDMTIMVSEKSEAIDVCVSFCVLCCNTVFLIVENVGFFLFLSISLCCFVLSLS